MIIFLYGEDTFRSSRKLAEIKNRFLREVDPSRLNVTTTDCVSADPESFIQLLQMPPFTTRKRLVILKNLFSLRSKEILERLDKKINDLRQETILVIYEDRGGRNIDGETSSLKKALFERLSKERYAEEFLPLRGASLLRMTKALVKEKELHVEEDAARALIEIIGSDLWRMDHELEKLGMLSKEGVITGKDIEHLVTETPELNIFAFLDAVAARDSLRAITFLEEQLAGGSSIVYLLNRLAGHGRMLIKVFGLYAMGEKDARQIAKESKLHPFQVEKALRVLGNWSQEDLKKFYREIFILDAAIKTSTGDPRALMTRFVASITSD